MIVTLTTPYDVAKHLRTPEESAAYLEACLEEANGDTAFIAKALDDIARAVGWAEERSPTCLELQRFKLGFLRQPNLRGLI